MTEGRKLMKEEKLKIETSHSNNVPFYSCYYYLYMIEKTEGRK
jgi:hypothetical protein